MTPPLSAGRARRWLTAAVAGSLLFTLAATPLAFAADDLRIRKQRVNNDVSATVQDLDQSSARLVEATNALNAAKARLAGARSYLARTRGELAAAQALDRQMQAKLDAAVRRLRAARAQLADGKTNVAAQEAVLGQIAVGSYQSGDPNLLGLSMMLTTQNPAELTSQLNSVQSVLDKESVTLDRLEAARVLLVVQEKTVSELKKKIAVDRAEAAANLARKRELESQATAAEARVAGLTAMRAQARTAASRARQADLARLQALRQERDRITELLRQRAEAARQRALAASAAATAAESVAPDVGGSRNSGGFLDYPVGRYITSPFGMRLHPIYKRWTLHDGTDFSAACGTPVRAAATGTVIARYYNFAYGNRVILDHGYRRGVGLSTTYNHLSGFAVRVGQRVKRGQVIAYAGTTGYSTGCHLHLSVFENGTPVDPMSWL